MKIRDYFYIWIVIFSISNYQMNIETRKQNLIQWISDINDDSLVKRLETIRSNGDEWAIEISDEEKKILQLTEMDIEEGNFIPHAQVMEELAGYLVKRGLKQPC